ncbi:hypothetical protein PFISCL1PPCAC_22102, partial [Pristionchus fissidentatus]
WPLSSRSPPSSLATDLKVSSLRWRIPLTRSLGASTKFASDPIVLSSFLSPNHREIRSELPLSTLTSKWPFSSRSSPSSLATDPKDSTLRWRKRPTKS